MPKYENKVVEVEPTIDTAKALTRLMEARDMSARDLSIAYGCSTSHIHNIAAKGTKTLDVIEKLSYHLDVDVKTFIEYGVITDDE